jgi:hypothetical protein
MKSENNMPGGNGSGNNKSGIHSNDYNNEISSGTIGSEGGQDNGASTLRALRKKHAEKTSGKNTRKSML